jgi:transposase InsO family protein
MNLTINTVIEWIENENKSGNLTERILWIDKADDAVVTIDIFSNTALPVVRSYSQIAGAFHNQIFRILEKDPFQLPFIPEEDIPEKHKEIRNKAWIFISEIKALGFKAFDPKERGIALAEIAKKYKKTKKDIYKKLRRYWQRGLTKNALLPAYRNCGAPGIRKLGNEPTDQKLGRKKTTEITTGEAIGIRITAKFERLFERGIKRHYENKAQKSLKLAHQKTLEDFFHIGYEPVLFNGKTVPVPILPDAKHIPTFDQFRYWYEQIYKDPVREAKKRLGENTYNLKHRALLGNSTEMAFGPGSAYQIDATIADLYLVSSFNRSLIIGRPVVYIVIDVFSRMIVGFAVTLEGPSWVGAMLALDNAMSDKVAFCAEYGIEIEPWEWDCGYVPKAIVGDRGEMESHHASNLVNGLSIMIINLPPYRPDLKAIVERQFRILNDESVDFIPGKVIKNPERGGRDYRLDAKLTLHDFRMIMIAHILNYNHNHYLATYRKDEFQIAHNVERFPIDLWNWGIQHRSGHLRSLPRDFIRLNLLPRKEVSITSQGIHLERELFYVCDPLIKSGLLMRKKGRKSPKVTVAYDPRFTDYVYLPFNGGKEVITCPLTPAAKTFRERDWYETQDHFARETVDADLSRNRQIQGKAKTHAIQNHVIEEATKKTNQAQKLTGKQSNAEQTSNIRGNRAEEKQSERLTGAWKPGVKNEVQGELSANNDSNSSQNSVDIYVPPLSNVDKIREIRKQLKGGRNE